MSAKIQVRRDTAAAWTAANPTLLRGEIGFEYDTKKVKIGDGSTAWTSLAYALVSETMVQDLIDLHADRTDNPHSVTKTQVGLGNADNTSDANKPISTATQAALDLKLDASEVGVTVASLDGSGKVPVSQLPSAIMEYKGAWNASTNSPTLTDGTGDIGDVYRVSVAGTWNSIQFFIGDFIIYSGSIWQRSPLADGVVSVNGYQGAVILTKSDLGLGSVDNVSAASLRDRSTHTGTQLASTISDFTTAVQGVTIDAAKIDGGVVSNAEFATLDGIATGVSIQSQIDGKQDTITGAASSVVALDLSVNRAVVSDATGKIAASSVTTTELGYVSGVTSAIQTQLNNKQATGNYITALTGDVTASGPGSATATLAASGVTAGTYDQVTVDTKGRVTAGSVKRYAYSTGAQTTNNTVTYAAVTGLTTVSLPAGLYAFRFDGQYQSAATATGVGFRVSTGTATVTTCYAKWMLSQAADGTGKNFQVDQLNSTTNVTSTSSAAANTNANISGEGIFRVTVAGTMQIQLRSEVAGSQVLVQPDAVFVVEQIA